MRERLTGAAPPTSSRKLVELWRDWIEERAGEDMGRLTGSIDDQRKFASAVRELIASLDMADELGSEGGDEDDDKDESGEGDDSDGPLNRARPRMPPTPRRSRPHPRTARPARASRPRPRRTS